MTFADDAHTASSFSLDTLSLTKTIDRLLPAGDTNLSAGFERANQLLRDESAGDSGFVILMTDGVPNRSLTTLDEFITGPVAEAESLGACVMAVGFGANANQMLLQGIAQASTCGDYYSPQNAFELQAVYAKAAAEASGENVQISSGTIAQDATVLACRYKVPPGQSVATFQLLWPGSILELQLTDPIGRRVEPDGDRVKLLTESSNTRRMLVKDPRSGTWSVKVVGVETSFPEGEPFHVIASTIAGADSPSTSVGGLGLFVVFLVVVVSALGVYVVTRSQRRKLVAAGMGSVGGVTPLETSLVVLCSPGAGQRIPLSSTSFTIGRSRESALHLAASKVSRRHAVIRFARGRWFIQDQDSTIGTYVNGRRIEATVLYDGDIIRIGETDIRFQVGRG